VVVGSRAAAPRRGARAAGPGERGGAVDRTCCGSREAPPLGPTSRPTIGGQRGRGAERPPLATGPAPPLPAHVLGSPAASERRGGGPRGCFRAPRSPAAAGDVTGARSTALGRTVGRRVLPLPPAASHSSPLIPLPSLGERLSNRLRVGTQRWARGGTLPAEQIRGQMALLRLHFDCFLGTVIFLTPYLVQAVRAAGKCDAVFKGFSDCLLKLGDSVASYPQGLDDKTNINTVCTYWEDFHSCTVTALTDCQEGAKDMWDKLRRESKKLNIQGSLFELCGSGNGAAGALLPALTVLLASLSAALATWLSF
ncbi:Neuritin, partial [Galemys pyrenaicus]